MTHTYTTPILCKEFCFDNRSGLLFRNIICCITQKDMVLCKAGNGFLFFYFHKLVFYLQQRSYVFKLTQTCNVCKKKKTHTNYIREHKFRDTGAFFCNQF